MERAEWINRMIKRLWPFVGHYVKRLLEKDIEPQVAETLKAYKIMSFRFVKTNLGNVVSAMKRMLDHSKRPVWILRSKISGFCF
jgi:hypothetical protein